MKIIWVATTGSDTTGDGSKDLPYATLDKALTVFENGDQIRLLDGVYYPSDSLVISNKEGSLFSENPGGATIRPRKTTTSTACIKIASSNRFSIQGINVIQAIDSNNNLMGIYAENVENFLCSTCFISDFTSPSGDVYGILAHGGLGRIEQCQVEDLVCGGNNLKGIFTASSGASGGLDIIDCSVRNLSGAGNCTVVPVEIGPYTPPGPGPSPGPSPGPTYYDPYFYYWQFDRFAPSINNRGGYLTVAAGDPVMSDFSPAEWGGDFTVMGVIMPNCQLRSSIYTETMIGKRQFGGAGVEWAIEKYSTSPAFKFKIGRAGFGDTVAGPSTDLFREKLFFVCGRYTAVGQGSSLMKFWINTDTYTNNSAWLISTRSYPLLIGAFDNTGNECFYSKYFWLAFWPRALTDTEIENLKDGVVMPYNASPQMYIDFSKYENSTGAMNYQTEIGTGSAAPYILTKTQIVGNPDHELARHRGEWVQHNHYLPDGTDYTLPDAQADDFNPANNGHDFSVAAFSAIVNPAAVGYKHFFSKWNTGGAGVGQRSWSLGQYDDGSIDHVDFRFWVTDTGAYDPVNGELGITVYNCQGSPRYWHPISFLCGTYHYNGGALNNEMHLYYNKSVVSRSDACGPVFVGSPSDLCINKAHAGASTRAHFYWVAYWQRCLTPTEVENLRCGAVSIADTNPLMAIYFDKAAGANYVSEIGNYNFVSSGGITQYDWTNGIPG